MWLILIWISGHSFSTCANLPKNYYFLPSDTDTYVCVLGGKKCWLFWKFCLRSKWIIPIFIAEKYLGPYQISIMKRFGENKTCNYFHKNTPLYILDSTRKSLKSLCLHKNYGPEIPENMTCCVYHWIIEIILMAIFVIYKRIKVLDTSESIGLKIKECLILPNLLFWLTYRKYTIEDIYICSTNSIF